MYLKLTCSTTYFVYNLFFILPEALRLNFLTSIIIPKRYDLINIFFSFLHKLFSQTLRNETNNLNCIIFHKKSLQSFYNVDSKLRKT